MKLKQGQYPEAARRERTLYEYGKERQWDALKLRVALGFPSSYKVGMSNLAFLWIYHLFNRAPGVRCDRFFMPEQGDRVATLEMGRAPAEYDVVAFSVAYEMDYAHIVWLLRAGGVEPVAEKRHAQPLVLAGGVAVSANPEPVAPFLDAVVVGDAEAVIEELLHVLKNASDGVRERLSRIPGVYVPSLINVEYKQDGSVARIVDGRNRQAEVIAAHIEEIDEPAHASIVSPGAAFRDMFLVELARGCPYHCRFCLTSHLGGAFRSAPSGKFVSVVRRGLEVARRVGLVGTAFADSKGMDAVCEAARDAGATVSFSSVRLTPRVLRLFDRWGDVIDNKTLTLAPEAATRKLRMVLNKNPESPLDEFLKEHTPEGVRTLKLYYLIGIPGEEDEDVDALGDEALHIRDALSASGLRVLLSVNPMIPKPHTPMQWTALPHKRVLRARIRRLRKRLGGAGIRVQGMGAREAMIQTVLSLGDRRLAPALDNVARQGCTLSAYEPALKKQGLSADFYTARNRAESEVLPWSFIRHAVAEKQLREQYEDMAACAGLP